jgi:radical SAM-linked protein
MQRLRVEFAKLGWLRFTGHLDLARAWERMLRRAALPLAYSLGHTPQPRVNLAAALPLGFSSQCELMDIWLEQPVEPADALDRLNRAALPGLLVRHVVEAPLSEPSLQSQLEAIEYLVTVPDGEISAGRLGTLMAAETLPRERRGKQYDLRPLIQDLWSGQPGEIGMRLVARPSATGRPDEVLQALEYDATRAGVHRTRLVLRAPAGTPDQPLGPP